MIESSVYTCITRLGWRKIWLVGRDREEILRVTSKSTITVEVTFLHTSVIKILISICNSLPVSRLQTHCLATLDNYYPLFFFHIYIHYKNNKV